MFVAFKRWSVHIYNVKGRDFPITAELMARIKRKASADSAATNAAFARAIVAMKALIDRHLPAVELSASVLAACEEAAELAAESPVETGEDDEAGSVEDAAEAALPPQLVPVPSAPSSAAAAAVADTQTPSSNSGGNNVEGRPAKRQRTTEEAPAAAVVPVPAAAKTPAASGRRATKSKASGASASAAPPPAAASAEAALPVAAPTVTKRGGNIKREAPVRSAAAMTSAGTYVMPSEPAETSTRPGADSPGVSASSADDAADAADAASASDEEMKEAQQEHPGIPIDQYFASLSSTQPSDYNDGAAGAAAAAAGEESAAAAALLTFPSLSQYTRVDTREMSQVAKEQAAAAEAASSSAGGSSAGTGQGAVLGWTGGDLFDEAFLRSLGRPGSLGAPAVGPPVVPRPMDGVVPNDTVITAARLAVHGGDVISRMVASGALSP